MENIKLLNVIQEIETMASKVGMDFNTLLLKIKRAIPSQNGFEIIESHLKEFGLNDFERKSDLNTYILYAYQEWDTKQDDVKFEIGIHENENTFEVYVSIIDSYYEPIGEYEYGKTILDENECICDNDNWEPLELKREKSILNNVDDVWVFIEESVKSLIIFKEKLESIVA